MMLLSEYIEIKARNKRMTFYKRSSIIMIFLILVIQSFDSFSAECKRQNSTWVAANGETYQSYQVSNMPPVSTCPYEVSLSSVEYNEISIKSEMLDSTFLFNSEMYDLGLEGIIKLFVAGIAIGSVLAMLNRLRR